MNTILLPVNLLYKSELETLVSSKLAIKKTNSTVFNCSMYHIKEEDLGKIINLAEQGSRALALRIVSKALQLRKSDPDIRMAMLSIAGGMGGWAPVEADRILRAV